MTIWADGSQIRDRVDQVVATHAGKLAQVMDMDETMTERAVPLFETHTANDALQPPVCDAGSPCTLVTLVPIDHDANSRTFLEPIGLRNLLRRPEWEKARARGTRRGGPAHVIPSVVRAGAGVPSAATVVRRSTRRRCGSVVRAAQDARLRVHVRRALAGHEDLGDVVERLVAQLVA